MNRKIKEVIKKINLWDLYAIIFLFIMLYSISLLLQTNDVYKQIIYSMLIFFCYLAKLMFVALSYLKSIDDKTIGENKIKRGECK